jgi:hypothetical protein
MSDGAEMVFWRDLAEDMCDPEFRAAFERTWAEIHGWTVLVETLEGPDVRV